MAGWTAGRDAARDEGRGDTPADTDGEIRKAILQCLPGLIAGLRGDERNVLLTLCRMWFTLETGEICPKDAAAAWAIPRLPARLAPLAGMARKAYLGQCADEWAGLEAQLEELAALLKERIEGRLNR